LKDSSIQFQTFAVFWMSYAFFWVIPRHLNIQTLGNYIQMPGNYPEENIQQLYTNWTDSY